MALIFGFDVGTTSIGFAAIDYDRDKNAGSIRRLGVRIFPEARDPDGTPLNQTRRQKRLMRRQLRRRRERRRSLNEALSAAGLLPPFGSPEWNVVMSLDPYDLRDQGLDACLAPHEVGRALYHLAKRRHFRGRDLVEETTEEGAAAEEATSDEKAATSSREITVAALKASGQTLGRWLAKKPAGERKRAIHAHRDIVASEFEKLWAAQAGYHEVMQDPALRADIENAVFAQRPVFWRLNTLGRCRLNPSDPDLCPKGAWLSQQRRMLEKLNNLAVAGGNSRPLDEDERQAILTSLQTQATMSWGGVRRCLKPIYEARGEKGHERTIKFNLELGGEPNLKGNAIEAKLSAIFGNDWPSHPHRDAIRRETHIRLWAADYGRIGNQRVVIKPSSDRLPERKAAAATFATDFGATRDQVEALAALSFPTGWEPYSVGALEKILPELDRGVRFGSLMASTDFADWRATMFPNRVQATGEVFDRLPSPSGRRLANGTENFAGREEQQRLAQLRNPTVTRIQNELRKVVNNLIDFCGRKPDLIRVELTREVGMSKRDREDLSKAMRAQEGKRKKARANLEENGIAEPSRADIEKWMLWKECGETDPYSGDRIGFDALFRRGEFEVEHIWPRASSMDDSFRNKTLCRKDWNARKGKRIPFDAFGATDDWAVLSARLADMQARGRADGMSLGKIKRFLSDAIPEDFASRQLNDTGYAARQIIAQLHRLWPDLGSQGPVHVQAVSGRVTAHLRRYWGLNNALAEDGEKTRADHRHHAVDALVVACTHPGVTNMLSRYWQAKDDTKTAASAPVPPPPWQAIRSDAERSVAAIVVSHRVRKKVSGPLHKETVFGGTEETEGPYNFYVRRKQLEDLSKTEYAAIRDPEVRRIASDWLLEKGGDPKKVAWTDYPRLPGGPEIRAVRLLVKQQPHLMAKLKNGHSDQGSNHHIAIHKRHDDNVEFEVVSLFEASARLARREPVVRRARPDCQFVMSLAPGDAVQFDTGDRAGIWTVSGAWANGQIVLERHTDADHATTTRPAPSVILGSGGRKIAVDPIGRVHPARD